MHVVGVGPYNLLRMYEMLHFRVSILTYTLRYHVKLIMQRGFNETLFNLFISRQSFS